MAGYDQSLTRLLACADRVYGPKLSWRAYWLAARSEPWQGTALRVIVLTTLVPTLVHAAYSLTLWQAQKSAHIRATVALMRTLGDTPSEARRIRTAAPILRGRISGFLRGAVFWGVPLVMPIWPVLGPG